MSCQDYEVCGRPIGCVLDGTFACKVPPYHRSYSWDAGNAAQLFEDLTKAAEAPGAANLLGAMFVAKGSGSPKFEVVDGQQRLATISLALCAVRSHLYKFRDVELPGARPALESAMSAIDGMLNVRAGEPRIELGKDDDGLFREILSTETHGYEGRCRSLLARYANGGKGARKSNRLLISNYRVLSRLAEKKIAEFGLDCRKPDGFPDSLTKLSGYVYRIAKRNHVAFVIVRGARGAHEIFASLNSAGQKLPVPRTARRKSPRHPGR